MNNGNKPQWISQLSYGEALRTLLCMLPMAIAYIAGYPALGVPMGQAGFFIAAQPLAKLPFFRLTNGLLFLVFGLGLYLIGGTVIFNFPVAIIYTFFVAMALAFMSGWRLASILSLTLFSVYSAGLNSSSPEKVTTNFYAFAFAIIWGTLISLPRFWKGMDLPPFKKPSLMLRFEEGMRMGLATTIALLIADYFKYTKMGWAPSAAANVIRFDTEISKMRALLRVVGTIIGAIAVFLIFIFVQNTAYWVLLAFLLAGANGLFIKVNKLGFLPFYTSVILILYSLNDPSMTTTIAAQRVFYNVVGVLIATLIVLYPFPHMMNYIRKAPAFVEDMAEAQKKLEA